MASFRFLRVGASWLVVLSVLGSVAAGEESAGAPRVFALSPEYLAIAKERIRAKDPVLKPAVDRLRRECEKALAAKPVSVMDKPRTPPSGDKHDYLSLAPYHWPNPDTANGMPYVRRDGQVNPESKTGTDHPAFSQTASSVQTLALAYYLLGDDAYAAHAARLLRVWFLDSATRMNPNLNYGQGIPGRCDGRDAGNIEMISLINIVDSVGLIEPSSAWTSEDRQGMIAWCKAYLEWMQTSKLGRSESRAPNNHGDWYDAVAVALALYVGQQELARNTLETCKQRRIDAQIQPDGTLPRELARTKSFSYSVFATMAFFRLASMGERLGVDLWHYRSPDGRSIRAALDVVAPYANPELTWPHPELKFDRSALIGLLQQAALVYQDPRYRQLRDLLPSSDVAPHRAQLLYPWERLK
jgi:hypothetical protein